MGGHLDGCTECGAVRISYNSCRNRHCPKCGGLERELWIAARQAELLPVRYYHVVFTLPAELRHWCRYNPGFCYNLLFRAAWKTLDTFARDPQWLGARLGATMVLHTWGQNLTLHPHVHCIVPGGGLGAEGQWRFPRRKDGGAKAPFLFPVKAMSRVFRAIYLRQFARAWEAGSLVVPPGQPDAPRGRRQWLDQRYRQSWNVYAKAPFNGPQTVIEYLGRYTHKVAISNHRIVEIDNERVHFHYKDYRQGCRNRRMSLTGTEFLRRFCQHILPPGFRRMRHYGILANFHKSAALVAARKSLGVDPATVPEKMDKATLRRELLADWLQRPPGDCPHCGGRGTVVRWILPARARAPPESKIEPARRQQG